MRRRESRVESVERMHNRDTKDHGNLPDNVIDFQKVRLKKKFEAAKNDTFLEAEKLVTEAWESTSRSERAALAKRALRISKDCADAYILLGLNEARNLQEEKEQYEKAVEAGKRYIGEANFKALEGHFWGFLETRPYMRAKFALADVLWRLGERAFAIGHLKDMMRLNPDDHQGVRYILINWLLEEKDFRYLEFIFEEFKEDITAAISYSELLYLLKIGNKDKAENKLREALRKNPYVPLYLTGKAKIPKKSFPFIGIGDELEAQNYVQNSFYLWKGTRGARKWLENSVKKIELS